MQKELMTRTGRKQKISFLMLLSLSSVLSFASLSSPAKQSKNPSSNFYENLNQVSSWIETVDQELNRSSGIDDKVLDPALSRIVALYDINKKHTDQIETFGIPLKNAKEAVETIRVYLASSPTGRLALRPALKLHLKSARNALRLINLATGISTQ